MPNLRYVHWGLTQQKEHPQTRDMAPVGYSKVEDSIFHFGLIHSKLFATFMLSIRNC